MTRVAPIAALTLITTVALTLAVSVTQAEAAAAPTLRVSSSHVLQRDPVSLSGTSRAKRVTIYRSLNGGRYVAYLNATTSRGRYAVSVEPVAGDLNRYQIAGAPHVDVTSADCAPLPGHGSTTAWFNSRHAALPAVAINSGRAICSAARGSTITVASMFIFGGTALTNGLITDLRNVARYRQVHVQVVVERSQFLAGPGPIGWTYAQFARAFSFATIHACTYGCTVTGSAGSMHMKYLTISRTVFGGSAVIESTLNWSPQQFQRQNGSAIYFYNNPPLYSAYAAESARLESRSPTTTATSSAGWIAIGHGVSYAFDPSTVLADPISNELTRIKTCARGDYVEVENANVTRGRLVRQLTRLRGAGCAVRVITEQSYLSAAVTYAPRHMTTHDKFVLVHAGGFDEVMTGSEDYRPTSMSQAEEQLVRVRLTSVVDAYTQWFASAWAQAA